MTGLLDFLFPRKCLGCGREGPPAGEAGAYFCSDCLNTISLKEERICPICQKSAFGGQTHPGCLRPYSLDGLTSIFNYQGLLKRAIKKLKYRFVTDLASDLAELFLSFCGEDKIFRWICQKPKTALVPIPLHPQRWRWRGFNQAELLGKMIAENLALPFWPDLLIRVKNTKPQASLDKKERQKNIKGAFNLFPNISMSSYLNILLFDDIWASGATLKEAAKVLKRNGAKFVWGLTLAG